MGNGFLFDEGNCAESSHPLVQARAYLREQGKSGETFAAFSNLISLAMKFAPDLFESCI